MVQLNLQRYTAKIEMTKHVEGKEIDISYNDFSAIYVM